MKCLERESVFEYVHRLLDVKEADEVRAHLEQCEPCRTMVADYERLGGVLNEWKAPEPSPWFDARLRARMAAEKEGGLWGVWGFLEWRRWLLPATIVALVVLAIVIALESPREPQPVADQQAPWATPPAAQAPAKSHPEEVARAKRPSVRSEAPEPSVEEESNSDFAELGDYELLANFDVLSELSKPGKRVDN